jgi:hypothetical protein
MQLAPMAQNLFAGLTKYGDSKATAAKISEALMLSEEDGYESSSVRGGRAMHQLTSVRLAEPTFSNGATAPTTYAGTGLPIKFVESQVGSAAGRASIATHGQQMGNGGRASIATHGQQMGNGGRASIATHGQQMGNGGRPEGYIFTSEQLRNLSASMRASQAKTRNPNNGCKDPKCTKTSKNGHLTWCNKVNQRGCTDANGEKFISALHI